MTIPTTLPSLQGGASPLRAKSPTKEPPDYYIPKWMMNFAYVYNTGKNRDYCADYLSLMD
jgi:hypothetical protein